MCDYSIKFNGLYQPVGKTKSGKYYYVNENNMYLFWDGDCNGEGAASRWIFSVIEPSTTAENDLEGEGSLCQYSTPTPSLTL